MFDVEIKSSGFQLFGERWSRSLKNLSTVGRTVWATMKIFSARFNYTPVFQGCKIVGLKGTYFHTKIPGETSLRAFPVCCLPTCLYYRVHNSVWNVLFQLCENWRHWSGGAEFISQLVCEFTENRIGRFLLEIKKKEK